MVYTKGDRVKHPKKPEWGIGQVLANSISGEVRIYFANVGEKTISLDFVQPEKLLGDAAQSPILDSVGGNEAPSRNSKEKSVCANCGAPTRFTETANPVRSSLSWCDPCFKHSQRTFKDKETGDKRYYDELRTVDGIKGRYSPR